MTIVIPDTMALEELSSFMRQLYSSEAFFKNKTRKDKKPNPKVVWSKKNDLPPPL